MVSTSKPHRRQRSSLGIFLLKGASLTPIASAQQRHKKTLILGRVTLLILLHTIVDDQRQAEGGEWSWRRIGSEGEYGDDDGEGDGAELRWSSDKHAEGGDGGADGGVELYQKDNMDDDGEGDCRTDQISMEVG
ncbi:hypothetical protein NE237_031163 [Protea cynaroides]|uniref:Uncharacterized protein n=1 Tax=Protea cynaroides TaxID=273540 RepID=A0A9Q0L1J9_9MAGN|nr:hypothetical protein NE237_031163 [Protea cynaroides]